MYKTGVYFGRFLPPHRGHLNTIINASTLCNKLYVVVSYNKQHSIKLCNETKFTMIDGRTRVQWLCQQLADLEHIEVIMLEELPNCYKDENWDNWCKNLKELIPDTIDIIFTGEENDVEKLENNFPEAKISLLDPQRSKYPISSKEIRKDVFKHWDYILGSARPNFARKILITGTESCGKTTLVKYLAKLYHTSWSEEVGRYYAKKYLGGNEKIFTLEDFHRITIQQFEQDLEVMKNANRVVFFDTDATITQYYCELFMGEKNDAINNYINPSKYDLVILLKPDVKWVSDGQRLNSDQELRDNLHIKLKDLYINYGFGEKIIEVGGSYNERLQNVIEIIDKSLR